ncbi:hypothetical protein Ae201684P_007137 [Aphanomyces euteiches]|nr:hypothetical protein Ae201684P_007137 [Aphanomyces euteiches]
MSFKRLPPIKSVGPAVAPHRTSTSFAGITLWCWIAWPPPVGIDNNLTIAPFSSRFGHEESMHSHVNVASLPAWTGPQYAKRLMFVSMSLLRSQRPLNSSFRIHDDAEFGHVTRELQRPVA